jgi:hypothetical protein
MAFTFRNMADDAVATDPTMMQPLNQMATQHPLHTMIAPIGPPAPEPPPMMSAQDMDGLGGNAVSAPSSMAPKYPNVRTMSPIDRQEERANNRLMADYAKDENPWGSPNNHPGFLGKFGHVLSSFDRGLIHATGGKTARETEEGELENGLQNIGALKSKTGLEGAQTGHMNAETNELEEGKVPLEQAKAGQAQGANETKEDIATQHNKTLEDIASMHQATQRAFQHVSGTSGGKDMFANYDPLKGVFTDLKGNVLTDFKPKDKAMQGAYGSYGPMRLAGQLLNYASNDNPALIPVLSPIISHMIAGAGGGNAAQIQPVLGQIPGAQPQDDQGNPIGLRMPGAPTGATRSRGQFAESVLPSIADAETQIEQLGDKLGPMSGRFSELYTGKIGAYGPEYSGLQTTLHNIGTAWMRLHANSESARQDFLNALSSAKDPANLIANLHAIDSQAKDYVKQGKGRGGQGPAQGGGGSPQRPAGVPAEAVYTTDPKTGKKGWAW